MTRRQLVMTLKSGDIDVRITHCLKWISKNAKSKPTL